MKKLLLAGAMLLSSISFAFSEPLKVGFVYVGPVGDHGWTYMHDIGRQAVESHFGDAVETVYVESVPEGPDAARASRGHVCPSVVRARGDHGAPQDMFGIAYLSRRQE